MLAVSRSETTEGIEKLLPESRKEKHTINTSSILNLDEVVTALSTSRRQVHKIDPPSTLTEADVERMLSESGNLPHKVDTKPFGEIANGPACRPPKVSRRCSNNQEASLMPLILRAYRR
jgi:hypothetical protein